MRIFLFFVCFVSPLFGLNGTDYFGYGGLSSDMKNKLYNGDLFKSPRNFWYIRSCRGNETLYGETGNCIHRYVDFLGIRNESDLILRLIPFCEEEYNSTSEFAGHFYGGFGSIMECVRVLHNTMLGNEYATTTGKGDYSKNK